VGERLKPAVFKCSPVRDIRPRPSDLWPCTATFSAISPNGIPSTVPTCGISSYCWKTSGGPPIRFHFRLTFTSTRLAILMKGMPLFIP
jgi:hypothetical protein